MRIYFFPTEAQAAATTKALYKVPSAFKSVASACHIAPLERSPDRLYISQVISHSPEHFIVHGGRYQLEIYISVHRVSHSLELSDSHCLQRN